MKLVFKEVKNVKHTQYPGVNGSTQVLSVRALLTRTLAEQLRCHDLCFAENKMPRRFDGLRLAETIENCEIVLDEGTWLANKVSQFDIGRPKEASATDPSLEISCNIHFDGGVELADWFKNQNKATYEMAVKPPKEWRAQGELKFDGGSDAEEKEDEDGPSCVDCANDVPFEKGSTTVHASGQTCSKAKAEGGPDPAKPTLASAREVGGGTRRGRRPAGPQPVQ